ncbi:Alkylhydroperoxidase family enzyme, contains CxxC motif [Paracoccus isoporae]|uniref:Alkylhydroperoxidase family enzyme, contains CxxC motif n=1 Tax=Paracoccus isoporae TaxID=591205 RepID=A0A1G7EMV6_9RHOB|nr:carboxymuconolactone decarboxylase family protein [Paracoccus isoporae]SDE64942.1 Alkylhydroperoxidase family enzyme, contains CxxC motif [Paracoccus isoporae]
MTHDFSPIDDADWPAEAAGLRDGFAGALNVYRCMAHHPRLLNAWAPLREHLVRQPSLTPQQSEIVILRAGHRLGSEYEWAHHVHRARKLGMADARIARIAGPTAEMEGEDGLLARAVDELFDDRRLSRTTQAGLDTPLGPQGMLDLIATVGFYSVLGFMLRSFDTPLDADVAREMAARPLPRPDQP